MSRVSAWMIAATIVAMHTSPAASGAQAAERWRLVAEARFGSSDDPQTELTRVIGIEVAPDGRVLIQDEGTQSIRRFAANGQFIDAIGRKGAGPGEFRSMMQLGRAPDGRLWINDPGNSRFSIHAADGSFVTTLPIVNFDRLHSPLRFDRSGRIHVEVIRDPRDAATEVGLQRRRPDGTIIDTIAIPGCPPPGKPRARFWRTAGGIVPVPLSHWSSQAYTADGTIWCSPGTPYAAVQLDLQRGDTVSSLRRAAVTLPIAKAVRDSAIAALRAGLKRRSIPESAVDLGDVPTVQAAIIALAMDDQRQLWASVPVAGGGTQFDIFSSDGRMVAVAASTERFHRSFQPLIRGGKVYTVVLDDDDVPTVVRFRIEKAR